MIPITFQLESYGDDLDILNTKYEDFLQYYKPQNEQPVKAFSVSSQLLICYNFIPDYYV